MKHTLQLSFVLAVLALGSCKPGDDNQNPVPTGLLSGYLTVARQLDLDSPATKYTESGFAAFFMHPYEQASDTMHILVDSVHLNNINASQDNLTKSYKLGGALQANANCYWQVWSSTNVASIAYNFAAPFPIYTYTLPDTIDRGAGFSISLPLLMDSATVSLSGNTQVLSSHKGTTAAIGSGQLANFNAGNATLEVIGYKVIMQAFGGKNFRFTKMTVKTKPVWLK